MSTPDLWKCLEIQILTWVKPPSSNGLTASPFAKSKGHGVICQQDVGSSASQNMPGPSWTTLTNSQLYSITDTANPCITTPWQNQRVPPDLSFPRNGRPENPKTVRFLGSPDPPTLTLGNAPVAYFQPKFPHVPHLSQQAASRFPSSGCRTGGTCGWFRFESHWKHALISFRCMFPRQLSRVIQPAMLQHLHHLPWKNLKLVKVTDYLQHPPTIIFSSLKKRSAESLLMTTAFSLQIQATQLLLGESPWIHGDHNTG